MPPGLPLPTARTSKPCEPMEGAAYRTSDALHLHEAWRLAGCRSRLRLGGWYGGHARRGGAGRREGKLRWRGGRARRCRGGRRRGSWWGRRRRLRARAGGRLPPILAISGPRQSIEAARHVASRDHASRDLSGPESVPSIEDVLCETEARCEHGRDQSNPSTEEVRRYGREGSFALNGGGAGGWRRRSGEPVVGDRATAEEWQENRRDKLHRGAS